MNLGQDPKSSKRNGILTGNYSKKFITGCFRYLEKQFNAKKQHKTQSRKDLLLSL